MFEAPIVALYSPAPQSGKTETARFLSKELGYAIHSFAAPIKLMLGGVLTAYGRTPEAAHRILVGDLKSLPLDEFGGKSSRQLQELIGETFRDRVGPGVWVDLLARSMLRSATFDTPIVIDDLRRPNEMEYLKSIGATTIKIVRPGAALDTASNEGLLDRWAFDFTITNDGSVDDLRQRVLSVVSTLPKRTGS